MRRTFGFLAFLFTVGCTSEPRPGDSCRQEKIQCLDERTELICQRGVFVAAACKGPKGCRETMDRMFCDFSRNETGDPCSLTEEGNGQCQPDNRGWVTCRSGKYQVERCRGEKGCHKHEGALRCDQSIAAAGDACSGASNACSTDGKRVLACRDARFDEVAECPGEDGCRILDGAVSCDQKRAADK